MFGLFKKKPKIYLVGKKIFYSHDEIDLERVETGTIFMHPKNLTTLDMAEKASSEYTKAYDKGMNAINISAKLSKEILDDVKASNFIRTPLPEAVYCPPPDTIESLLNKFIEAGYDKPEVVIKGETKVDGSEVWTASIDKQSVVWRKGDIYRDIYRYDCYCERSIGGIEKQVIEALKKLAKEQKRFETTITY